jgi:hypothetical protein
MPGSCKVGDMKMDCITNYKDLKGPDTIAVPIFKGISASRILVLKHHPNGGNIRRFF